MIINTRLTVITDNASNMRKAFTASFPCDAGADDDILDSNEINAAGKRATKHLHFGYDCNHQQYIAS